MRKLSYDQMRLLSSVGGADNQKIQIRNNKGKALKALPKKWHQSPKETASNCFQAQPKPSHVRQDHRFLTCQAPSYSQHPQLRAKR